MASSSSVLEGDEGFDGMCSILDLLNFKVVKKKRGDTGCYDDRRLDPFYMEDNCQQNLTYENSLFPVQFIKVGAEHVGNKANFVTARAPSSENTVGEYFRETVNLKVRLVDQQKKFEVETEKLSEKHRKITKKHRNTMTTLRKENRKLSKVNEKVTRENKALKRKIKRQEKDLANSQEKTAELEAEKTRNLQLESIQLEHEVQEVESLRLSLDDQEKYFENEIKMLSANHLKDNIQLKNRIVLLEKENQTLMNHREKSTCKINYLEQNLNGKDIHLVECEFKIQNLGKEKTQVESQLTAKLNYIKEVERIMEQQQKVLKQKKERYKNEKAKLQDVLINLELDSASKDGEIEKLQSDMKQEAIKRVEAETNYCWLRDFLKCCNSELEKSLCEFSRGFNLSRPFNITGCINGIVKKCERTSEEKNAETRLQRNLNTLSMFIKRSVEKKHGHRVSSFVTKVNVNVKKSSSHCYSFNKINNPAAVLHKRN